MSDNTVKPYFCTEEELQEYLEDLDALRKSGKINIFGAAPVLARMHGLDDGKARLVLAYWMETFSERHNPTALTEEEYNRQLETGRCVDCGRYVESCVC